MCSFQNLLQQLEAKGGIQVLRLGPRGVPPWVTMVQAHGLSLAVSSLGQSRVLCST